MFLQSVHNWSQKKQVFHSLSLHQNPQWFWYFPLVTLQPENVEDKFVEHLKPAILDKLFFRWFWFWIFGSPEIGLFCIGNHNTECVYRFADETRPNSSCFWKATPLDNCNYTFYTHTHKSDRMRINPSIRTTISFDIKTNPRWTRWRNTCWLVMRNLMLRRGEILGWAITGGAARRPRSANFRSRARPHLRNSTDLLKNMKPCLILFKIIC